MWFAKIRLWFAKIRFEPKKATKRDQIGVIINEILPTMSGKVNFYKIDAIVFQIFEADWLSGLMNAHLPV